MSAVRKIAGVDFVCDKLPGDEGLALFLRASAALRSARGLFIAIADDAGENRLIHEYFEFARDMDPAVIHPLTMELASLPKAVDGSATLKDFDLEAIIELAFFGTAVNFGSLLPAGIDPLFQRSRALRERDAGAEALEPDGGGP